jgi:hypothetical protein
VKKQNDISHPKKKHFLDIEIASQFVTDVGILITSNFIRTTKDDRGPPRFWSDHEQGCRVGCDHLWLL